MTAIHTYTLKLGPRIYGPRRCLYLCPGGLCFPDPTSAGGSFPPSELEGFCEGSGLWLRSGAGRAQLATSRVTGPGVTDCFHQNGLKPGRTWLVMHWWVAPSSESDDAARGESWTLSSARTHDA